MFVRGVAVGLALAVPARAQVCDATPFTCQVHAAIQEGLTAVRTAERGIGTVSAHAGHNPLAILALLDQPRVAGGPPSGYARLTADDQALTRRLVVSLLNGEPGFHRLGGSAYAYVAGSGLAALARFRESGGPDDVGATIAIDTAMTNARDALLAQQADQPPNNDGGFNYTLPAEVGDLSATLFALIGLAVAPDADGVAAARARVLPFLRSVQTPDGGGAYQPLRGSGSSTTAALIWAAHLAGRTREDPLVADAWAWLRQNYLYDRMIGPYTPTSTYASFWAVEQITRLFDVEGAWFGDRDPAQLGHPEEPRTAWFDVAVTLLTWQDDNGMWGHGFAGSPVGWDVWSSHLFALLTLERSTFGGCLDADLDDHCHGTDVCPQVFDPEQEDADGDGVGDACDLCPDAPDVAQRDADGDGLGDACDPLDCVPDGQPEICDGLDNDCDGEVDTRAGEPVVAPQPCATARHGPCGEGRAVCQDGEVVCRALIDPVLETCNLVDDDCDGAVDEDTRGACGYCDDAACPPAPEPACPACPDDLCRAGECLPSCAEISCLFNEICIDGVCIDQRCGGRLCTADEVCVAEECHPDPCLGVACDPAEVCFEGACIPHPCADATCPTGQRCEAVDARPRCVADWLTTPEAAPDAALEPDAAPDAGSPDARPPEVTVETTRSPDGCQGTPGQDAPSWVLILLGFRRRSIASRAG